VARYLINHGLAVEGVDASAKLISHCRRQFPQRTWHAGHKPFSLRPTRDFPTPSGLRPRPCPPDAC
jgi:hypothetical protein